MHAPQYPHRWYHAEAVAKTLHPTAFVINRDEQRRTAQRTNFRHEVSNLLRRFVIAAEQDDAADGRLTEQIPVRRCQADAFDIEHHRSE